MRLEAARSLAVGGVHPTGTMCGGQITIMMVRLVWNEPWPASMMPCTYISLHTSSCYLYLFNNACATHPGNWGFMHVQANFGPIATTLHSDAIMVYSAQPSPIDGAVAAHTILTRG
jgi:hypothetical protein